MSLTERSYPGECVISEANGTYCRGAVTIAAGQSLEAGAVLGKTTESATATANDGNTGSGTIGDVTLGDDATTGAWTISFTSATAFTVTNPDGDTDGTGTVGTAYDGGIGFTITAGDTAYVSGDSISVAVVVGGLYAAWNPDATDGTATVAGVLWDHVTTDADATAKAAALVRGPAELVGADLNYSDDITDSEIETAQAGLETLGFVIR